MSKTDKTTPWRVVKARGEHGRGECGAGYPCPHVSLTRRVRMYRQKATRQERTKVRLALARGVEPPTDQHRHGALWDAV